MKIPKQIWVSICISLFSLPLAYGQNQPVGYWESLFPYNSTFGVVSDGTTLFTISELSFFTLQNFTAQFQPYSKVDGMSDVGMQSIAYDVVTGTVVLGYADGNVDLFKDNTFYNIPDFKIKNIPGSKTINQIYTENGFAYLSTSQGVIVMDIARRIDTETIQLRDTADEVIPVTSFAGDDSFFYEATANGLFRASRFSQDLQFFQLWQLIDSTRGIVNLATVDDTVFLASATNVYIMQADTLYPVYASDSGIQYINAGRKHLLIGTGSYTGGKIVVMDTAFQCIDSFECSGASVGATELINNTIWYAPSANGLSQEYKDQLLGVDIPGGPNDPGAFGMWVNNRNLWVAHGGFSENYYPGSNWADLSNYNNGKWADYAPWVYAPFDTLNNVVTVLADPLTGTVYSGSLFGGLFIMNTNGTYQDVRQNSLFDTSTIFFGDGNRPIISLALDQSDNLWMSAIGEQHNLYVKTADSNYCAFALTGISDGGPLAIDANGQIWIASIASDGVEVYNTNNTVCNMADDASYHLTTGVGSGNLPSNNALCLAVDLNNNVWIGTDNGIGIVSNCNSPFTGSSPCDAEIPIVQYDQFAGYLFAGYTVTAIAVDGANRKWVGTDNGVWLLSPDASTIVYYFTAENSPLPSDAVRTIAIDQVTGDVYFGTDKGIVSFHSTATEGGTSNQNVTVYPDPVPSGYSGTISIKGLAANADVRITDIDGQLVYRTTALGGQAVWNGKDYTGHRPQSGVYLVLATSSDGSQTYSGKLVFLQ